MRTAFFIVATMTAGCETFIPDREYHLPRAPAAYPNTCRRVSWIGKRGRLLWKQVCDPLYAPPESVAEWPPWTSNIAVEKPTKLHLDAKPLPLIPKR